MSRPTLLLAWSVQFLLLCQPLQAQVVINEACSNNVTVLLDGGRAPDWIELYNSGTVAVDLQGHYLTDDPDRASKWRLPTTIIEAGGYVVLLAGNGHVRKDIGIPLWLAPAERARAVSIGLIEDKQTIPADELARRFDHAYLTATAERVDPCIALRARHAQPAAAPTPQ